MKKIRLLPLLFLPLFFCLAAAAAEKCDDKGKIYKVCSDQGEIFQKAAARAKEKNTMVVSLFGADWCPWCRSLSSLLSLDSESKKIAGDSVIVEIGLYRDQDRVESGWKVLDELTKQSAKKVKGEGVPLLAVTNPKSNKTIFIDTESLEKNTKVSKGHDPQKLAKAVQKAMTSLQ